MPFTELEKPVKAGFAPAVLSLDFKVMPRFCRYLLEHKLEEFSRRSLRLSLEVDLPMLRFFKTLLETTPEETLVQMGMESNGAMLTAFAENKTEAFIEKSVDDWINNRITGLERGQVEVMTSPWCATYASTYSSRSCRVLPPTLNKYKR